jgi:hypothetical protein
MTVLRHLKKIGKSKKNEKKIAALPLSYSGYKPEAGPEPATHEVFLFYDIFQKMFERVTSF